MDSSAERDGVGARRKAEGPRRVEKGQIERRKQIQRKEDGDEGGDNPSLDTQTKAREEIRGRGINRVKVAANRVRGHRPRLDKVWGALGSAKADLSGSQAAVVHKPTPCRLRRERVTPPGSTWHASEVPSKDRMREYRRTRCRPESTDQTKTEGDGRCTETLQNSSPGRI